MNVSGTGVGGYFVVDPMPDPFICPLPEATWFESIGARWDDQLGVVVSMQLVQRYWGISLQRASVDPLVRVDVLETTGTATVRLSQPTGDWPEAVELYLVFRCDGRAGGPDSYEIGVRLFTDAPATSGTVRLERIVDDEDAGI